MKTYIVTDIKWVDITDDADCYLMKGYLLLKSLLWLFRVVHLSPTHHRGLDALAALVVAETGVGDVRHLGEPEGGIQLPPHAVPVQLLLILTNWGPQPRSQNHLGQREQNKTSNKGFRKED